MSVFDHIDGAVPNAEGVLVDACTITRPGVHDADSIEADHLDDDTWEVTPPPESAVYTGPCLVSPVRRQGGADTSTGGPLTILRYRVRLPRDTVVEPGDVVRVTASDRDATLVGKRLVVGDVDRRSLAVMRIIEAQETDR